MTTILAGFIQKLRRIVLIVVAVVLWPWVGYAEEGQADMQYDVVIIGASYAESWPIDSVSHHRVLNVGVGGEETGHMLARFEADVVSHDPNAVVIWGFINDVFRSPTGQMSETEERIKANFLAMIQLAEANGIRPIIASEVTMGPKAGFVEWAQGVVGRALGKKSYQDRINADVRRINEWIRETCSTRDLVFLDLERALVGDNGERTGAYSQDDGSHISELGYRALSKYALPVLESSLN